MRCLRSGRGWLAIIVLFAVGALHCLAAEVAVLRNGFSIRHERREIVGDTTRLYVTADGASFVDVPTAEIEHFEAAPELPASGSGSAESVVTGKSPLLANYARNGAPDRIGFTAAQTPDLDEVVNSASGRYRLDPDLVNSVIKAESGFNARAVSPKGAQGLMQLMPGTASQLGVPNAFDPQANVEGGAKYLRELLERYDFDLVKALAAYNAGPQRVEQFGGVPPYYETRVYVARVVRDFNKKKEREKAASSSSHSGAGKPASKTPDHAAGKTQSSNPVQTKDSAAQAQ
jgi:Transglycosylase SLT domain